MEISKEIEALVLREGGNIIGYASVKDIKEKFHLPLTLLAGLDYAISVGVKLNREILRTNLDSPSLLYKHHYRQLNMLLDRIAHGIAELAISHGSRAIPVPASVIIDWEKELGHLPHKEIAYLAGLGWRGKNNLLVTKKYGGSLRLVTVLTDIVFPASKPAGEDCGSCAACQPYCPAGAIKDSPEKFDHSACYTKVKEFSRKIGVGICGLCLGHCPQEK